MPEIIKPKNDDKKLKREYSHQKFIILENVTDYKKLKPEIELCIVKTNFCKSDLKIIKKIRGSRKDIEFWICSDNLSRENILIANKIGIKNVISSPIDTKMVEEFFANKDGTIYTNKLSKDSYDYSSILDARVMIVDDNPLNVELLDEILSTFGVEICKFSKPKDAYQIIEKEKFDLILLDVMMPEMSGFELAKKIKNSEINKNAPIIFISALSDSQNKIRGYDLGSFAYIEKPFDVNIVKSQIFNLLKNQKTQELLNSAHESFLATIAHDLKTPINAEINALNLLLNRDFGNLGELQQEILEDILNSTKFMQDMVENILCKNKIENNKIILSKQVYSLKEVVEHCIELTKYILEPKKQQIVFECDITNTLLPMDFMEIKRAINNLITNASEYSPHESKIVIKIIQKNNKLGLYIQDFGKGVEIEDQVDIFHQYISYAKKYKKVGTGLGLYITKRIIEAHKGEIVLESQVGYGTRVTFLLPKYTKE